jgi:hypothetical protein
MKRYVMLSIGLFLASVLLPPAPVSAQIGVGIGAGLSAGTWGGSDADDFSGAGVDKSTRKGLRVAGFVAIPVANRLSIVPGASFVQKGVVFSEAGDELTFKTDYVEIPVLLSVALAGADSPVGFSLYGGPTAAFEAGCDVEGSSEGVTASVNCDSLGLDERQSFDLGAMAGASVSFPVSDALSILLSGGANFGLRTLDTSTDPDDIKNRSYYGTVFATFPVGG